MLYLYGKLVHSVYGTGHQCTMNALVITTSMSFFGAKYQSEEQRTVKLSAEECKNMLDTKKCQRNDMKCDREYCSFIAVPKYEYGWLSTKTYTDYSCSIKPRVISAVTENDRVFGTKCIIKDLKCELQDSIIIWNLDIIHKCPYYEISYTSYRIKGFFLWNEKDKLGFQYEKFINACDTKVIQTTEGLFLSRPRIVEAQRSPPTHGEIKEITNLLLADEDYVRIEAIEARNKIVIQQCTNLKNTLRLLEKMEDRFLITEDYNKNEIIFYANHGNVYRPRCATIKSVEVLNNTNTCYNDLPVSFRYNNATLYGFLNTDGIIRRTSSTVSCDNFYSFIPLKNANQTIVRKGTKALIIDNSFLSYDGFSYDQTVLARDDLYHSRLLIDSVDEISSFIELIDNEINTEKWYKPEDDTNDQETGFVLKNLNISKEFQTLIYRILTMIMAAIVLILVIIFTYKCLKWLCCKYNKKNNSNRDKEDNIKGNIDSYSSFF